MVDNMVKGLTVPKWAPKIHLPKLSAQAQKFLISMKKRFHWASVIHGTANGTGVQTQPNFSQILG